MYPQSENFFILKKFLLLAILAFLSFLAACVIYYETNHEKEISNGYLADHQHELHYSGLKLFLLDKDTN